jgi:hypothetical protein
MTNEMKSAEELCEWLIVSETNTNHMAQAILELKNKLEQK